MAVYSYHPPAPFAKVQCLPYVQPPVSPALGEGAAGWEGGSGCQLQQAPSSLWPCSWWDPSEHTGSAYARAAWGASNLASGLWIWSPPTALGPGPSHFSILSSISPCVKWEVCREAQNIGSHPQTPKSLASSPVFCLSGHVRSNSSLCISCWKMPSSGCWVPGSPGHSTLSHYWGGIYNQTDGEVRLHPWGLSLTGVWGDYPGLPLSNLKIMR